MAQKKSVILRIDPKLWEDLNIWAKDELRSLNGQMEYLLREAVKKRRKSVSNSKNKEKYPSL